MAITTASYTLNGGSSNNLATSGGAVNRVIDLVADHGSFFYHCESTPTRFIILNRILVSATNDASASSSLTSFIAREPYKFTRIAAPPGGTASRVSQTTTLREAINATNGDLSLIISEPIMNTGPGTYALSGYKAEDIDKLFKIGENVKVGLKIHYSFSGGGTKAAYINIPVSTPKSWENIAVGPPLKVGCGVQTFTTVAHAVSIPTNVKRSMCTGLLDESLDSPLLDLFDITLSNVAVSSQIVITPFLYVGEAISGVVASPPASYSEISRTTDLSNSTPLTYTTTRVGEGWSETITVSNTSPVLGNTLSDDVGFVAEFDSGATTDTSITITIG